ncbi:unnamed protein product [Mytilus edulis]|uniref:Uncharacterized protein n=1 Tax=Mytilus edulis TaxID=6550 RepID=A0A8S3R0F0_MYTED|nr:unnamed protein product [Mytilus edulis]
MKKSSFRQHLLQYLQQLEKSKQVLLAISQDKVISKEDCGSGNTPLILTCYSGYTDMVQWMLHNDVDVDQCRDDGVTGLIMASQNGYTDIVKLLALIGNLETTQLLVRNNADCNLCCCSKQSLIDTIRGHSSKTLEEEKQICFDYLINKASSHVADFISKKSVDYVFDIEAGCSPLHYACFMGRIDVVHCLLDYNANINMTNEDETTPLFLHVK